MYTLPVILEFSGVEKNVTNRLNNAFKDVGKQSSKAFADGTEADLKRATDAYGKLRDRAEDALGKVRVEEEKLAKARAGGKTDQIVAAEERLNKARRDATRVNKEAIAQYSELEDAQKRLATSSSGLFDKLKGMGGAAAAGGQGAAEGFVDGFGGPIAALGTKAGPIGLALAAAAALGLGAGKILGDQILAGMDQLQGQADIAAKLGISAEQIKPIAKAAADAYVGNFGASITDNMDAATAAIQGGLLKPDATAADVKKIVEQLSTVAKVTGDDIPAAARAAAQALRTGMAGSATEAFDLVVRAQQSGLNASGDLMDTINEYSTQFRKLGLNGQEAMGLISQAVKGGARDTDVAADALKEFAIRAVDGSKTTGDAYHALGLSWKQTQAEFAAGGQSAKDAFQKVVSAIAAVEDPAKRAQIQVALFGTQSEDLGAALNNMNLGTAAQEFDNVAGATQRAADTAGGTAAASWESAKRSVEVAVQGMQQSLGEVFGPALQKIADWVVAHKDEIGDFFLGIAHAAIDASAWIAHSVGDIMSTLGQLGGIFGDIQGGMLKFQAWQADIRGDTETAAELRKQAEAAFGFGEGLTKAGDAMKALDPAKLHAALDDAAAKAKGATTETNLFGDAVDKLPKDGVTVPIAVDTDDAKTGLDKLFEEYKQLSVDVTLGSAAAAGVDAGALLGAGIPMPGAMPGQSARDYAHQTAMPYWEQQGLTVGDHAADQYGEHQHGAVDVMVPDIATGAAVLKKALTDPNVYGIIFNNQTFGYGHGATPQDYSSGHTGNPTQDHQDHVHIWYKPGGDNNLGGAPGGLGNTAGFPLSIPGAAAAAAAAPSKPLAVTVTTPSGAPIPVPDVPAVSGLDTSRIYADTPGTLTNAFGPGYKPGIGTPGRDEYGDPGYYRVDPRKVDDARWAQDEAQWRIGEADAAAQSARDARAALDDDPNATPTSIAGADHDVKVAERAAATARRGAATAAQNLAEAQRGDFTKAQQAAKQSKGKGGGNSMLSELGGIGGSFLKETFGIGDWLPDLADNMFLKMADGFMSGMGGSMLKGAMDGGLNFQNPDWQPGMTKEDLAAANAASGWSPGGGAFGIPDIGAPPMPDGSQHAGAGGAPGPAGTVINVDQSQNFQNSNLGWDPAQVEKQRQNNINRAPRLPVGVS